jgi:hypothetical protein
MCVLCFCRCLQDWPLHKAILPRKAFAKMVSSWSVRAVCALLLCLVCVMQAAAADDVTGEAAAGFVLE